MRLSLFLLSNVIIMILFHLHYYLVSNYSWRIAYWLCTKLSSRGAGWHKLICEYNQFVSEYLSLRDQIIKGEEHAIKCITDLCSKFSVSIVKKKCTESITEYGERLFVFLPFEMLCVLNDVDKVLLSDAEVECSLELGIFTSLISFSCRVDKVDRIVFCLAMELFMVLPIIIWFKYLLS